MGQTSDAQVREHGDEFSRTPAGEERDDEEMWTLTGYFLERKRPPVVPAPPKREWMADTFEHFAKRCLPMMIANQSGWFVLNTHTVRITWNGGPTPQDLEVAYADGIPPRPYTVSNFGHGIVSWTIPILFRTSPEFNLLARGPANLPKAGAYPYEGVVETDWTIATFTMNWQIMTPDLPVFFEKGEPICMIVPQRKEDLERIRPQILPAGPDLRKKHERWAKNRKRFIREREGHDWEKDYMRGRIGGQEVAERHRTRLKLRKFERGDR